MPTEAIHFGDLTDPESKVSKKQALGRDYADARRARTSKPRTQYLARISNPHPPSPRRCPRASRARDHYDPHPYGRRPRGADTAVTDDGHGDDHGRRPRRRATEAGPLDHDDLDIFNSDNTARR